MQPFAIHALTSFIGVCLRSLAEQAVFSKKEM
jgi:hypothetical protein